MTEQHPIHKANVTVEHALHLNARRKLRIVAIIDIVKGLVILALAFGLLRSHNHVLENGGISLLGFLDVDVTLSAPRKFLAILHAADNAHMMLTLAAAAYASLRFVEAYGLWFMRNWARWLGIVSAGIYVPFELYYFVRDPSWASVSVLSVNLIILWLLWPRRP